MLINEGGRFQSVLTDDERLQVLAQNWQSMTEVERDLALAMLQDFGYGERSELISFMESSLYRTPLVSMQTFLEDPYFLGAEVVRGMYPKVKSQLLEMFSGPYSLAFLGGSLGAAKTTQGVVAILRMIYEVSCMKDPQIAYGISKSDNISFAGISTTEDVAERNIIEKIRAIISDAPYFKEEFKPIKNTAGTGIIFPNRIIVPPGASTEAGVLGTNCFGAFIDEGNFFRTNRGVDVHGHSKKSNIQLIYEGLKRRIQTRFMNRGKLPGILIVASSKTHADSFTDREIATMSDRKDVFVAEHSVWEVVPPNRYSGAMFRVALGSDTEQSRILAEGEPDPDGLKIIEVPEEYRDSFETDLDKAIRDVAGYSTTSITPFIARKEKIYEAIDPSRQHPFTVDVWEMSYPASVRWEMLCKQEKDGAWRPLRNPQAPRHIHLDLSATQDSTGITVGHIGGYAPVQKVGSDQTEMLPIIDVDFMLKCRAPRSGEINYTAIRKLIYDFSSHGFFVKLVTADQYQSRMILQTLAQQGYRTKTVSVEAPGGPYELLKSAIYENRLRIYNYKPLITELKALQKNWKTGKVDHTETSEKDVSDSLAGTLTTLMLAQHVINDQILISDYLQTEAEKDESWVLDHGGYMIEENKSDRAKPAWRENAEQAIHSQGRVFEMPFEVG